MCPSVASYEPCYLAAWHEAGHAVAVALRGGSTLTSVSLGAVHGEGLTEHRSKGCDSPFIAWAGAWAEARCQWPAGVPLDGETDYGTLSDCILGVLLAQPDDLGVVQEHWRAQRECALPLPASEAVVPDEVIWTLEMERVLPVVAEVAARLLGGQPVTHGAVVEMLGDHRVS